MKNMTLILSPQGDKVSWDSPIKVTMPMDIWDERYKVVVDNFKKPDPEKNIDYMYDIDESNECGIISLGHLSSFIGWFNKKYPLDLGK